MNTTTMRGRLAAAACLSCALALSTMHSPTTAAERAKKQRSSQVAQAKERKGSKATFEKATGETAAERDRRLQRECRGRPNAGACLGYGG